MSDDPEQQKLDLTPLKGQEHYLLHSPAAIQQVLGEVSAKPDIVTAYFSGGNDFFITLILAVMKERNLVVFDYGPDENRNRRLLEQGHMTCVTKHNDILVRFSVKGVQRARYHGQRVFVAPLPEELLRLQRREYFRVHTPVVNPVICRLPLPGGGSIRLPLTDISVGGVGMLDRNAQFEGEPGEGLSNCALLFPDNEGSINIDLQIRSVYATGMEQQRPLVRIGAAFLNLPMDNSAFIQRYIHQLQVKQKSMLRE